MVELPYRIVTRPVKMGGGEKGGREGMEGRGEKKEDEVAHSEAVSPMQLFSVE